MATASLKMLNKYGYDGLEDPERRQRMVFLLKYFKQVYYERYEILKSGVPIPSNISSELNIKLIPTYYQNNIRDFHYTENKQYLTSLRPNDEIDDDPEILDVEVCFIFNLKLSLNLTWTREC